MSTLRRGSSFFGGLAGLAVCVLAAILAIDGWQMLRARGEAEDAGRRASTAALRAFRTTGSDRVARSAAIRAVGADGVRLVTLRPHHDGDYDWFEVTVERRVSTRLAGSLPVLRGQTVQRVTQHSSG